MLASSRRILLPLKHLLVLPAVRQNLYYMFVIWWENTIGDNTRMGESILFPYSWLASWIAEVYERHAGMKLFLIGRRGRSRGSSRSKVSSPLASPVSG